MKITKRTLRDRDIVNPYDLAKAGGGLMLCVSYRTQDTGRMGHSSAWQVWRVGYAVDRNAHWQDNGSKTFLVWGKKNKESVRLEALKWASDKYKIAEWEKSPFGTYHPAGTIAQALETKESK